MNHLYQMYSKHIYQDYNQMLFIHRILGSQTLTGSHQSLAWEKCTYKFSHTIQLLQRGFHIILINGTTQDAQIILVPIS